MSPNPIATLVTLVVLLSTLVPASISRKSTVPLLPADRRIDDLGRTSQIRSEVDARAYVQAFIDKFDLGSKGFSQLDAWASLLAKAEYDALQNPSRQIPEKVIAQTFDRLMDQWNTPAWTRVSISEFHSFRVAMASVLYPQSVSRLPDGSISRECRPVEAVYLVYLLESQRGIPPAMRKAMQEGPWPPAFPEGSSGGSPRWAPSTRNSFDWQHEREYREARSLYFENHPEITPDQFVTEIFQWLGIQ